MRALAAALGLALALSGCGVTSSAPRDAAPDDPYLWLEAVDGERALAWVRERSAHTRARLEADPGFAAQRERIREVLDSKAQIPQVVRRGAHLYNFWRDGDHPRGLWRRTTPDDYRRDAPAWELLLDLDALARDDGENWVWAGAQVLGPRYDRALLKLSRGGADAVVVREFDLAKRRFVAPGDGGFVLPEAKTDVAWLDDDTLLVGTDFGAGSLTDSGYPRVIRRWRRGRPLADAPTVFEGRAQDVSVGAWVDRTPGFERTLLRRAVDFYREELYLLGADGAQRIDKPDDADLHFWRDRVLVELRSDWPVAGRTWPAGSLLVADAAAWLRGERRLHALFTPTPTRALAGFTTTRTRVLLEVLEDVSSRIEAWQWQGDGWRGRTLDTPSPGSAHVAALHDPLLADDALAERFWLQYTDFLTPDTLYLGDAGGGALQALKSLPAYFDAGALRVEQRFVRSRDGTRVPYFVVGPRDAQAGPRPTLLYGYGGFEVSLAPWYLGATGRAWLEAGGVFVVANIRGGGEYGPAWHQAALKAGRQHAFDDFVAVAEDLIARGATTPRQLGIQGGSNGGLLVGAVMLQRPALFGAVVCQVPLLDMRRYHRLLAGASWIAEYGDPDDPQDWAALARYSPYHQVRAGTRLPPVLFTTSTRDDRVHPGHARKMAARMIDQGHDVLYFENIEGGHAGAADNAQRADMRALEFTFLWQRLGGAPPRR